MQFVRQKKVMKRCQQRMRNAIVEHILKKEYQRIVVERVALRGVKQSYSKGRKKRVLKYQY